MADLAMGLALRGILEASSDVYNVLILDEPFEGISSNYQPACQGLLGHLGKGSVFLISHQPFVGQFDKHYSIYKREGISHFRLYR